MTQFHVDPSRLSGDAAEPIVVTQEDGTVINVQKVVLDGPCELVYLPESTGPHVVLRTAGRWIATGATAPVKPDECAAQASAEGLGR